MPCRDIIKYGLNKCQFPQDCRLESFLSDSLFIQKDNANTSGQKSCLITTRACKDCNPLTIKHRANIVSNPITLQAWHCMDGGRSCGGGGGRERGLETKQL